MLCWWTLVGTTDVYTDRVDTINGSDGYRIVASHLWRDISYTANAAITNAVNWDGVTRIDTDINIGAYVALGTCIETLDYDGAKLAAGTDNQGNYAICHWFYSYGLGGVSVASNPNHTGYTQGGTIGVNWGETRIYNAYEWGNGGSGIFGANIQTQGTALTATQGFELSHTSLTQFVPGTIYSMSWYQPKYSASGYPANSLRRYSGGNFGTRADKVKAYSRSLGTLDRTVFELFTAATQTGSSGTVTLSGAASLVAGLSFGIAALAF